MSQPGPVVVVSDGTQSTFAQTLANSRLFPIVETDWPNAADAIERVKPASVIMSGHCEQAALNHLADQIGQLKPYVPLIVVDTAGPLPLNAIPFSSSPKNNDVRFHACLNAALRIRTLHATVLRRIQAIDSEFLLPDNEPLNDVTVLLVGRSGSFPGLSIALGERTGIIGALSIEAAANHLNNRSVDGIVISEGFSPRVVDAFLRVLSEDSRFRHLPIIATTGSIDIYKYDLPNLETRSGSSDDVVSHALPLLRQSAFQSQLERALQSLEAGGLLDARTGLLTNQAFARDFADAIDQAGAESSGLSVASFTFSTTQERSLIDAARIMRQLMRRMDFATLQNDGSIIVVFARTDLRDARLIARRLSSVLRQTVVSNKPNSKLANEVSVTAALPGDNMSTILYRLRHQDHRAAS